MITRPRISPATAWRTLAGIAAAVPAALLLGASPAAAHPMPHSVVLLDVHETTVTAQLELPVDELSTAGRLTLPTTGKLPEADLRTYLTAHLRPATATGEPWHVEIDTLTLLPAEQTATGPYQELVATATLTPPPDGDVRHFTMNYDAIVHQVVTHVALVSVRQDWAAGHLTGPDAAPGEPGATTGDVGTTVGQVGTVQTDIRTMTVPPLQVDLGPGSAWRGFLAMLRLGGEHILTGTDHLLFLLILLLPAPLIAAGRRWRTPASAPIPGSQATTSGPRTTGADATVNGRRTLGNSATVRSRRTTEDDATVSGRRTLGRIGRTTLAFTIGHSVALAVSALGRLDVPAWPVEAFIAVSILVGAVHAVRPLFPGREALVAGLFGLGHGLAFSFTLAEMHLSTGRLALSLLGFNLGIELVQLLLVALALPTLLTLARRRSRPWPRLLAAALTAAAATAWLFDRLGVPNPPARLADSLGTHPTTVLVALAAAAALTTVSTFTKRARQTRHAEPRPARPSTRSGGVAADHGCSTSIDSALRHGDHRVHDDGRGGSRAPMVRGGRQGVHLGFLKGFGD